MLKFKDKQGKTRFILQDDDTSPQDIETLVLEDLVKSEEEEEEEDGKRV